ncbi:hypothetical protein [Streptomyces sp. DSS69]|uniref:hypothetical protein n=1 Tax=Streptomyces sp. DSS69 TaxID=3113369 RepID=UPI0031F8BB8C
MPYAEYARYFKDGEAMFRYLTVSGLRRVAATECVQKDRYTHLALVQFGPGLDNHASDHFALQLSYMPEAEGGAGNAGDPIEGTGRGRYFLYPVEREAGYLPLHRARALAVRGDIMIEIDVSDVKPISKKDIRVLAERQLGRL